MLAIAIDLGLFGVIFARLCLFRFTSRNQTDPARAALYPSLVLPVSLVSCPLWEPAPSC